MILDKGMKAPEGVNKQETLAQRKMVVAKVAQCIPTSEKLVKEVKALSARFAKLARPMSFRNKKDSSNVPPSSSS
jgi:hypothetical protein